MLTIDGSMGEGGGQILRSALGLSLVTGTPFRIENIRGKRAKPGLLRQHLTAVKAAVALGQARVEGDQIGSRALTFVPGELTCGDFQFAIGTAGSTSLVLQAILPALLVAPGPSEVVIEGGTHNPWAPPYAFLARAFAPLLARMGAEMTIELLVPGFYPAGGGRIRVRVKPVGPERGLAPLELLERGELQSRQAIAQVANLPKSIAKRELKVIGRKLKFEEDELIVHEVADSRGPGNLVTIVLESEHVTEVFTGFGELGKAAERVAGEAVHGAKGYLASTAPVGRYLADQLLIPMAMAGGGVIRTLPLSRHTLTNIAIVEAFLPVSIARSDVERDVVLAVRARSA